MTTSRGEAKNAGGGIVSAITILSCQRFASVSNGLQMEKSTSQVEIAASLPWLTGSLIDFLPTQRASSSLDGRRLSSLSSTVDLLDAVNGTAGTASSAVNAERPPPQLATLLNQLCTLVAAIIISIVMQVAITWFWRSQMNSKFYAKKTQRFVPFPKSLVWPNVPVFLICCFATGPCTTAVSIIAASPAECGAACPALGAATLVLLSLFVAFLVTGVSRVRSEHDQAIVWIPSQKVATPSEVDDPLMALRAYCYAALTRTICADQRLRSNRVGHYAPTSEETQSSAELSEVLCENTVPDAGNEKLVEKSRQGVV